MIDMKKPLAVALLFAAILPAALSDDYAKFDPYERGLFKDPNVFPIGVWLQRPLFAAEYKALGINYYLGLHEGPTAEQMALLRESGMRVISFWNAYAEANLLEDPLVVGWMHLDEPDLAHVYPRALLKGPTGKAIIKEHWPEIYEELDLDNKEYNGWGLGSHPINDIQKKYKRLREMDPTRPVLLQLSKAVANKGLEVGRGDRSGKTWEYPLYIEGSDYVSFDIYPVAYGDPDKLYQVADGVAQLAEWGRGSRPQIVAIEAGFGDKAMADASQQRAQIWMAINHGASGIFYFCHRWTGEGSEQKFYADNMPIRDKVLGEGIKKINAELQSLAPVINSPRMENLVKVANAEIDLGARAHEGKTYLFAVERGNRESEAEFTVEGIKDGKVEVIGEGRDLILKDGKFSDKFTPFQTHLYKVSVN